MKIEIHLPGFAVALDLHVCTGNPVVKFIVVVLYGLKSLYLVFSFADPLLYVHKVAEVCTPFHPVRLLLKII